MAPTKAAANITTRVLKFGVKARSLSLSHDWNIGQGLPKASFASVLEAFFSTYGSINSFSRMTARIKQGQRVIKQWPPNSGDKFLL